MAYYTQEHMRKIRDMNLLPYINGNNLLVILRTSRNSCIFKYIYDRVITVRRSTQWRSIYAC